MRKRYKRVEIHLTEEEHRHLKKQVSYTGLSTESFIRSLIMGLTLYSRPPDEYAEIRRQLAAIGNNINQITRAVNARSFATKEDIIGQAYTYDSFLMLLRKNGYEVRRSPNRKYTTVKPPGAKRAIRLDSLGEGYTEADILLRLSRQRHSGMTPPIITHAVKRYRMKGKLATVRKKKITGFHALYLRYLYLLRGGRRKKLPPKLPFSVKREVIHLERYEQQFKYLLSSGITTETELEQRIRVLEWDIRLLEEQRKPLYQERRNTNDEEAQAKYSAEIQQQTATLREKRGELRLCRRIQADIPRVSQQCQQAQAERQKNLKNKEEHEHEYQR